MHPAEMDKPLQEADGATGIDVVTKEPTMQSLNVVEYNSQYGSNDRGNSLPTANTTVYSKSTYIRGCLLMLGASFSTSIMSMIVHSCQKKFDVSARNALFIRGLVQAGFAAAYIAFNRKVRENFGEISWAKKRTLALRGFAGATSYMFYYIALGMLPLGLAVTIYFLCPVFMIFFASVFLKEAIHTIDYVAAVVSFSGLLVLSRPDQAIGQVHDFRMEQIGGIIVALTSAILGASGYTLQRLLGKSVHVMHTVFSLGFCSVIISGMLGGGAVGSYKTNELVALCFSGLFAFSGQFMSNKSVQVTPVAPVALIRNLDIPLVYFMGVFLLQERLTMEIFLGSCLVVSGSILVGLRKIIRRG